MSVYEKLSIINVNDKKSKKNNLDYFIVGRLLGQK